MGRGSSWRTFVTEGADDYDGEEAPPDDSGAAAAPVPADLGDSFEALVNVFTATADRLKGITLGRGFSKSKPSPRRDGADAGAQSSTQCGTAGGGMPKGSSKGPPFRSGKGRGKGRGGKGRGGFNLAPGETFTDPKKHAACSVCGRIGH